ncbi:eukaryotic translation initiation factor 3 subunit A [Trifolium repens]|nr:eukaryotic translation initiation factor 3 subunit A [Trifolium repens]
MKKKWKKLATTMDYLERTKREEAAPLIEAAYQQQEVEWSKQCHAEDLNEKQRLSRMLGNNEIYKEKVVNRQQLEEERLHKLHVEEEARKLEEVERKKKEETERLAKLNESYEKQRQREKEIEEKAENQKREALLGRPIKPALRPYEPPPARRSSQSGTAAPSTSEPPAPEKYVPKFRRGGA